MAAHTPRCAPYATPVVPRHTLLVTPEVASLDEIVPDREEARHAVRVKRIEVGDAVRVLDGEGAVIAARVAAVRPDLVLKVESRGRADPPRPRVEVWSATPKGPRLEEMIDQLSQVGASSWRPLETALGVVEPGAHKMERCARIARESAKQCGRAWLMRIQPAATIDDALASNPGVRVVVADASGAPAASGETASATACHSETVRLLVGPEGGWTGAELARFRERSADIVSFGPHVLRIETAAVVACARLVAG